MKDIAPDIGLSDATFKSCELLNGNLTIILCSWDNCIIEITFYNIIEFTYKIESVVDGVYEKNNEQNFLNDSLLLYYNVVPKLHPFKVFVVRDIDDEDFIKVVAEKAEVVKKRS